MLYVLLGSIWRWWDGTNGNLPIGFGLQFSNPTNIVYTHIRSRYRVLCGFLIALLAAISSIGLDWWVIWASAWAIVNLQTGYFWRWEKPISTGIRFAIVGLIAMVPFMYFGNTSLLAGASYAIGSGFIGPLYWVGLKTSYWRGWFIGPADGFEWWMRFLAGGIVIGGLALI